MRRTSISTRRCFRPLRLRTRISTPSWYVFQFEVSWCACAYDPPSIVISGAPDAPKGCGYCHVSRSRIINRVGLRRRSRRSRIRIRTRIRTTHCESLAPRPCRLADASPGRVRVHRRDRHGLPVWRVDDPPRSLRGDTAVRSVGVAGPAKGQAGGGEACAGGGEEECYRFQGGQVSG